MMHTEDLDDPKESRCERTIKSIISHECHPRFSLTEQELETELSEVEKLLENEQLTSKEQLRKHSMLVQVKLTDLHRTSAVLKHCLWLLLFSR